VLAALEDTCRARLLEEEGTDAYRFAHDVIREVVEADLGGGRRTVLHRRVAEVLEAQAGEPPLEQLAYHYGRSDAPEKAVLYLEQAGDRARAQTAHAAAQGYYGELVARLDGMGRARDAARAREKLSAVLRLAARYDAALEVLEQAADTYRTVGDLDGLGRAVAQIGHLHPDRGTLEEGLERIQAVLTPLETSGARQGVAALYAKLAFLLFVSGRYDAQLVMAMRGAELARAVGDDTILAGAEAARGHALLMLGRLEEALSVLNETISVAEAAGDHDSLASTLTITATAYMYRGEFDQARRYAERSIEVVKRLDHPAHVVLVTLRRAYIAFFAGDWQQARATIEWTVALEQQMGGSWAVAYPLLSLGALCLLEGAWEEAVRHLERSAAIARRSGDVEALRRVQIWLAERDLLMGQSRAALERLVPLLDRPGLEELDVTVMLPRLARAYLELDDDAQAAEVAERSVGRARAQGHRVALVDALWAQGMVASRQGRWEEAARALEEGLSLARSMPYPYAEARLLHVYGQMHAQKGEQGPAHERLEEALAILRRLGARVDAERVEQTMVSLPRP
jgi:tetratricopeptide (TPR) repeat protein